jgi:hypothetical protein
MPQPQTMPGLLLVAGLLFLLLGLSNGNTHILGFQYSFSKHSRPWIFVFSSILLLLSAFIYYPYVVNLYQVEFHPVSNSSHPASISPVIYFAVPAHIVENAQSNTPATAQNDALKTAPDTKQTPQDQPTSSPLPKIFLEAAPNFHEKISPTQ